VANPQAENGHIDIANEIAEHLMNINLTAYQYRILWAIWRKTYGWHKKEDWISNSQLIKMTGLRKGHISRTLKQLIQKNIVTRNGNKLSFNKNYHTWKQLPNRVTVTQRGNTVTNRGNKVTRIGGHKRNYTKETNTKENIYIVFEKYKEIFKDFYKREPTLTSKRESHIRARLKRFSEEELIIALQRIRESDWHIGKNPNGKFYATPEFCFRNDELIENWLNEPEKEQDKPRGIDFTNMTPGEIQRTLEGG
jgi:phage replication O-like protein O